MTSSMSITFGAIDYWRMYKKYGLRLPISYFLNSHLFDLTYGTDTHVWLPHDHYPAGLENVRHGVLYMGSWTSELKRSFYCVQAMLKDFESYCFVDIGSGKGKAVLVWKKLLESNGQAQRIVGIEYNEQLAETARSNFQLMYRTRGEFLLEDATTVDYSGFGRKLIIYLYNPFDEFILERVIGRISTDSCLVIYNNPVYSNVLLDNGMQLLHETTGYHPSLRTKIFWRGARKQDFLKHS